MRRGMGLEEDGKERRDLLSSELAKLPPTKEGVVTAEVEVAGVVLNEI